MNIGAAGQLPAQPAQWAAGPNGGGGVVLLDPTEQGLNVGRTAADVTNHAQVGQFGDGYVNLEGPPDNAAGDFNSGYGYSILTSGRNVTAMLTPDSQVFGADRVAFWFGDGVGDNLANVIGRLYFGRGVPITAGGANGDIAFRFDGGAGTTIYQKRAGVWVGIL